MLAYMKRTTIKLPDDVDALLRHEAERRGVTISELTREAIQQHLQRVPGHRQLRAAGAGRSGRDDISERIEEILTAEVATSP
jgi:predicted transcriptional regulator